MLTCPDPLHTPETMYALRTLGNVATLVLIWAMACVGLGVALRAMAWLFCVGYGC